MSTEACLLGYDTVRIGK